MDAKDYVEAVLEPMVVRYLAEPGAKELGFAACMMAFHFVEYAQRDGKGSKESIEAKLRNSGPEFEVAHAVGTAAKHTSADNLKFQHTGLKVEDLGLKFQVQRLI